jgi:thioesterase domain-containing protein
VLTAPPGPNHNHLGTAFGGSLATAAILAGYTLLWLEPGDRGSHIVIQESHLRYKAPVRGDIRAVAPRLEEKTLQTFRGTYQRTGKARLTLAISILSEGKICVEFTGTFVALR